MQCKEISNHCKTKLDFYNETESNVCEGSIRPSWSQTLTFYSTAIQSHAMSGTHPACHSVTNWFLSCIQIQGLNHITEYSEGRSHSYVTNNRYRTLHGYVSNVGWPAHVAGLLAASVVPFCAQSDCSCYTLLSWQTWASHHAGTQPLSVSHPAQCSSWL